MPTGITVRGAWLREPVLGSGTIPVATYSSWDKAINTGGGELPLRMITDITVSPTHRRRGLLRTLITDDLRDAADHGVPLAALTVSEGSIYGRFGFGVATHVQYVEVDTTARFALREPVDGAEEAGRIELVEPDEAWKAVQTVFAGFHRSTRGSVERPEFYRHILSAAFDFREQSPDRKLRTAVHLDHAGEPDGYVVYSVDRSGEVRAHRRDRLRRPGPCGLPAALASTSPASTWCGRCAGTSRPPMTRSSGRWSSHAPGR